MKLKSKNKKIYLGFVLFTALIASLTNVFRFYRNNTQYEVQDWLINYQGGFVRRGLSGEIFLYLSNLFNTETKFFYLFFLFIILIYFFYLLFNFLKNVNFNFLTILIVFCPLSIFYNIFDAKSTGRKEILFLLFFLIFLKLIEKIKHKENSILLLGFVTPFLLLIHEGILFYLPYFFIPLTLFISNMNKKKFLKYFILYWAIVLVITFILSQSGASQDQVNIMCNSLKSSVAVNCQDTGAIAELTRNLDIAFHDIMKKNLVIWKGFVMATLISFILGFFPLFIATFFIYRRNYYFKNDNPVLNAISYQVILFLPLIFSLPLYFFGQDWGRWLHTSYTFSMFCFIFFIQKRFIYLSDSVVFKRKFQFQPKQIIKKYLSIFLIIIYCLGWYLPNCCTTKIESPLIKSYININRAITKFF